MHVIEDLTMPKLIPYSRFSGKRQEAGDSQRRQDALAEEAAREEKVQIDRTLTLRDKGISAFRGANWKRGYLGKFLDLVNAGVIPAGSILCIERVNRLSRQPWMEQVQLWKEILARGVVIRTCEPKARYTAENMNELTVGCPVVLFMMLGHMESKQKSDWSFQAFDEARARTRKDGTPHGLDCPDWIERITVPHPGDPSRQVTTGYKLIQDRARWLRWMHEKAQEGWGVMRISKALDAQHVPAWGLSGRWSEITVRHLLTSPQAFGEYQPTRLTPEGKRLPAGPAIAGHYPAAITEECFRRTQAARRSRRGRGGRRGPNATNLFTHVVKDTRAEESVHVRVKVTGQGARYEYLTLDGQPWTFPYRDFERGVLLMLADLNPEDVDGRHEASALSARAQALLKEHNELVLELDDLDTQLREVPREKRSKRVVARMCELEQEIPAKKEELRVAQEAANTSGRADALADLRSCIQLLDRVRGTAKEQPTRHRIKARVPLLVESIWVRVQVVTKQSRYLHVQVYLHGGSEPRYLLLEAGTPTGHLLLEDADFRAGEERGYAAKSGG
jgi:DNA invertase Pin-like site-specific DNA recombinase